MPWCRSDRAVRPARDLPAHSFAPQRLVAQLCIFDAKVAGATTLSAAQDMKSFICEQNIAHFQRLLSETSEATLQRTLRSLLATSRRELAMHDADRKGADVTPLEHRRRQAVDAAMIREQFLSDFDGSPHPYMLIDPGPGLSIIDINAAYAAATFTSRDAIVGRSLFEVFPDNPDDPLADGVSNLFSSLKTVAQTGLPHAMAVQRYDVRDPAGVFLERHWQPINTPVHDGEGRLVFLLHHVEDVTDQLRSGEG
jgi:PAS domain-containing protein